MASWSNDLTRLSAQTRGILDRGGGLFIDGEVRQARSSLPVIDPSSNQAISSIAAASAADIDAAVGAARAALDNPAWRDIGPAGREAALHRLADAVAANADVLAELESVDVGMPHWMSRNLDIGGTVDTLRYMAGWPTKIAGQTFDVSVPIPGSEFFGYTRREPVGVIGAIIPWNVPLMLAVWKLAPALAAGCTVVMKPSEEACLSVLELARLAHQAGIPAGVFNVVTGTGREAGEALVAHPGIDKVTFTGSTATGRRIAAKAAETTKKLTLELGGKSPQILFADAELDEAVKGVADAIFLNSGQVCVAGSRLYVERRIHDAVVERLAAHADALPLGAPLAEGTILGPLASARQHARVRALLDTAIGAGAQVATRQDPVADVGNYLRPTILSSVTNAMEIAREEVFGPVLTVTPFDDLDEAATLANDTDYGLSACIWTSNLSTAHRLVRRLTTGKVAVNTPPLPYPALPEGGRKASGYGRDLGEDAVAGFLETKSLLIRLR